MVRRIHTLSALAACALTFAQASAFADVNTYDFSTVQGVVTPVTIGLATFSSPSDPGAFTFGPNAGLYTNLGAYVLSEAGFGGATLNIAFSAPQTAVSFDFSLGDFFSSASNGPDTLTVTPNVGSASTATASLVGSDYYPEGTFTLTSATAFSSIAITSAGAYPITIADMTSTSAAPVPEADSYTMMLCGLGMIGAIARRKKRSAA
ncbi:MAG: PEP-CTERM sorting domain-containing protein [Thiobacillaceae bacterium]